MKTYEETVTVAECMGCTRRFKLTSLRRLWIKCETIDGMQISMEKEYIACPQCCMDMLGLRMLQKGSIAVLDVKDNLGK